MRCDNAERPKLSELQGVVVRRYSSNGAFINKSTVDTAL
jgi:hypothetical protein